MKRTSGILNNESGMALLVSLALLTVLAVLAMAVVNTTNVGQSFSAEYKQYQVRIYLADGGADYGYSLIERAVANDFKLDTIDTGNANVTTETLDTDGDTYTDLEEELAGSMANNSDSYADASPDIQLTINNSTLNIDVDFNRSKMMPGSSSEFASRYEGIGTGSSGGVGIYYAVDSAVTSGDNKESVVRITFRCMEGGGRCL